MPILTVRHVTTYRYRHPVAFGEHRMMLRPRDDGDQTLLDAGLDIMPEPSRLIWTRDGFGNHIGIARFASRAAELRFESRISVDHAPSDFRADDIAPAARMYPFAYDADERAALAEYLTQPVRHPDLDRWAADRLQPDGSADTHDLLVGITRMIRRTFRHGARHQKGTQDPLLTLRLGSGSCRDVAVFMIAILRMLGIAARFVSGYLHLAGDTNDHGVGGNTHAWVQAYLPGCGWVDFDPSSGSVGNRDRVRVAVARTPWEAIPLQGTWLGKASDHLAMDVAVRVAAA